MLNFKYPTYLSLSHSARFGVGIFWSFLMLLAVPCMALAQNTIPSTADAVLECLNTQNRASIKVFYCPDESDIRKLVTQVIQSTEDARLSAQIDKDLESMLQAESENFVALSSRISAMFDKVPVETRYPQPSANYRDLLMATCNPENIFPILVNLSKDNSFREKYKTSQGKEFPTINTSDPSIVGANYLVGCENYTERKIQAYRNAAMKIALQKTDLSTERIRNQYVTKMNEAYEELLSKLTYYSGIIARIVSKFPNFTGQ